MLIASPTADCVEHQPLQTENPGLEMRRLTTRSHISPRGRRVDNHSQRRGGRSAVTNIPSLVSLIRLLFMRNNDPTCCPTFVNHMGRTAGWLHCLPGPLRLKRTRRVFSFAGTSLQPCSPTSLTQPKRSQSWRGHTKSHTDTTPGCFMVFERATKSAQLSLVVSSSDRCHPTSQTALNWGCTVWSSSAACMT